jgi:hypothetical protein
VQVVFRDWWLVLRKDEARRGLWDAARSFTAAFLSAACSHAKRFAEAEKVGGQDVAFACDFRWVEP